MARARQARVRLTIALAAVAAATLVAALVPAWSATTNPATPGRFTGLGFDQCQAPSQRAMDVWKDESPFSAVGIYISGNSRFCRVQHHLDATWVRKQLANGWHLLPITLGPQASCSSRFPRYGEDVDPTIDPTKAYTYAKARAQGRAEADRAVAAAKQLGIVPGSTLFYDIEGWSLSVSKRCNHSAVWFLSSWSNRLHKHKYLSGVYSSTGSGIKILDTKRQDPPAHYVGPDMIWLACWDGHRNTSADSRRCGWVSDAGWSHHQRVKQFQGGHDERHGGVTINIDRNYLDLRPRAVPGHVAEPADPPTSAPSHPQDTSKCTRASISRKAYRLTSATRRTALVLPLQCLLAQHGRYHRDITGRWDLATATALNSFYRAHGHAVRPTAKVHANRRDWIQLLTLGSTGAKLRRGSTGPDVIRLQRAMNAATSARLAVTGTFGSRTATAVKAWKADVFGRAGAAVIGARAWKALHRGRW